MNKTIYVLKLENPKNIEKLIKYHVYFIKIKYTKDTCFLYVDEENYLKIQKYFGIFNIILYKIKGVKRYQLFLKKYCFFIFSLLIGIMFSYLLSNIIFDIKIMTNKKELIEIINRVFHEEKLEKYHFIKSFEEKERIKNRILTEYKDQFEWIEIDRIGTKYYVHILERINRDEGNSVMYQNVVARKNAVIVEIKAKTGEIIKKINDYVNKGDVIISGNITKNDEIKNTVKADGTIYGEVWYNVRVELPLSYEEKKYTGKSYSRLSLNFFDKKIILFKKKKYIEEEYDDKLILNSKILPFSLARTTIKEVKNINQIYTYEKALDKGINKAREKLMETLGKEAKILSQKKLKLYEENSTIIIEVFFKVYENITDFQEILKEGE